MTPARMAQIHAAAFAGHGQIWSEADIAAMLARPVIHAVSLGSEGFALLQIMAPEAELLTIAIDLHAQGKGHGAALLRQVMDAALAAGAQDLFLEVAADNARALALYARAGFVRTGLRRGYYARPGSAFVDALTLRRVLSAQKPGSGANSLRCGINFDACSRQNPVDPVIALCPYSEGVRFQTLQIIVTSGQDDAPRIISTGRYTMTMKTMLMGAAAGLALSASGALADGPAIIFDLGGKFDGSFNEAAFNGAELWASETGGTYSEIELTSDAQREQAMRRLAEAGSNPIVMAGFSQATALSVVAPDYPDTKFVIIDGVVDAPNVRSVIFSEHEGSYLVGMLAAMASEAWIVGFVGGMDIPLISRFGCGYAQGAAAVNPAVTVIANMTGTTPSAWNDPVRGGELTRGQIAQGADVVYAAAGGTGFGVLQVAADEGILSIGVDSNQNHLHPGSVLTSMLKRVDVAVHDAFTTGPEVVTGVHVFGLAEEGVGYALDDNNAALITAEMQAAVDTARAAIIAGEIKVHNFTDDGTCPVQMQ